MGKLLLLLFYFSFVTCSLQGQTINVDDLLNLSSLSSKNTDSYLNKKGFVSAGKSLQDDLMGVTFVENNKLRSKDTAGTIRSISIYKKDDIDYYVYHTSSAVEYLDGQNRLKKAGFLTDTSKRNRLPLQFQKRNLIITVNTTMESGVREYIFSLEKKELPNPSNVRYAEDLLRFDSHEYLVSFFGQKNVKEDVYYFTEKDLKKCSVLFPNTSQQVTFVWNEEATLSKLSYILISGILPTANAMQFSASVSENTWKLKSGVYSNMTIRELLAINEEDFEFFGRNSEFSYMVNPASTGKIDFKKIGVTLGCFDCTSSSLMDKTKIKASDAIDKSLALYVVYIMIMP